MEFFLLSNHKNFIPKEYKNFFAPQTVALVEINSLMLTTQETVKHFAHQIIDTNLYWGDTKYKVSRKFVYLFLSYTYHKIFGTHTQAQSHTDSQTHRQITLRIYEI